MNTKRKRNPESGRTTGHGRSGQALVEFVVVAVVLLSMLAMLSLFLYTFRAYGNRTLSLVASEYP